MQCIAATVTVSLLLSILYQHSIVHKILVCFHLASMVVVIFKSITIHRREIKQSSLSYTANAVIH